VVVTKIIEHLFHRGKIEMFLAILSRIRSRMFLGDSGDGDRWIYVDGTSGVEATCVSERASES